MANTWTVSCGADTGGVRRPGGTHGHAASARCDGDQRDERAQDANHQPDAGQGSESPLGEPVCGKLQRHDPSHRGSCAGDGSTRRGDAEVSSRTEDHTPKRGQERAGHQAIRQQRRLPADRTPRAVSSRTLRTTLRPPFRLRRDRPSLTTSWASCLIAPTRQPRPTQLAARFIAAVQPGPIVPFRSGIDLPCGFDLCRREA